ncbi:serine/threonine-protein kinase [Jidongwangia harbinensis]|uniref:serine/threonine-protein kinase n=1 Tax=Jidongwangia harbinensis TaxID=2878561 RepID=UPI001CD97ECB|nr:serine/threonine-protein kinase [Jidongwangia harbinensis]MCA2212057.1 serine/threonine protein kinase [Jidongwangia harbinensis]
MQPSLSLNGAGSDEPATVDLSGRCVGTSYVLICPVGQGATGTVWRGIDRTSGEQVAVKLLHEGLLRQPKLVTRFVQERTILMMVRHENIVGVRDLFSAGESLGLVMDFVAGGSLRDRLRAAGTLPPAEAARLLGQVAAGLAEAHALGVVHRDVKPDNILLHGTTRPDVRLTDFGIARVLDTAGLTTPHAIIGTPHYMAPETIGGGDASPAADVYALGVVFYELLTGRAPYAGEPIAVLRGHLDGTLVRPEGLADEVWAVVESCVDPDPARRPPSAELRDVLRDLSRRTAGLPALPAPDPDAEPVGAVPRAVPHPSIARPLRRRPHNGPRSWVWARRGLLAVLVTGTLTATGLGGYQAWQGRQAGSPSATAATPPVRGGGAAGAATSRTAASGTGAAPAPDAPSPGRPGTPATTARTGRDTEGTPSAAATVPAPAGPGRVDVSVGPGEARGSVSFGPWRCGEKYSWDVGHPVLAQPCHAVGAAIRVSGEVEATPGVQADVSLTVRDAGSDEVVAGPHTCEGLMFTDFALKHRCGPADLQAPRGGRYVVVLTWQYSGRSLLPGGTARGREFTW